MTYSRTTKRFAYTLVTHYAHYVPMQQCFDIAYHNIPETDLYEFCAYIMQDDPQYAAEATGPDNPAYSKTMLPALILHLQDITDVDRAIAYKDAWLDGILAYYKDTIVMLLEDALSDYNSEQPRTPAHIREHMRGAL